MTREEAIIKLEEALKEVKLEMEMFLTDSHAKGREKEVAAINEDFRIVYETNMMAIDALKNQRIGRWVNKKCRNGSYLPCCSACGESSGTYYEYNYCPNCGAKMEAEE